MLAVIDNVLSADDLEQVSRLIEDAPFKDGRLSAGSLAATIKNNLEIPGQTAVVNDLNNIIMNKLVRHPQYRAPCRGWRFHPSALRLSQTPTLRLP